MSRTHENVTDHYITINGLNIHYRDWGDPQLPPLLILHGGGNSISRTWDHVAAALANRFRIIVPDLRGNGESSWAPDYSWRLILDDALHLMDALGLRQTVLCGHSLGGRVAYGGQPYADKDTLRHEVELGLKQLDDGRWTWRMDPAFNTAAQRGQLNPGTKREWPALAQIRCPSVLIYGIHSLGKMGTMITAIAQAIPNCQLIKVPDAAHDVPNENPTGFIRALRAYLTETPDANE